MRTFTLCLSITALMTTTANAQYCMLPGRTAYASVQPGITNFKLGTINRTSGNIEQPLSQPPVVVTTDSTTLMRGQTYTVYLSHSEDVANFPDVGNNIRVWIDYNKDFDFLDAGETVATHDNEAPGTTDTLTFTVPMTASLGYTRLRATAKMGQGGGHTIPTSCDVPADPLDYHGEMEDYTVRIADPTSVGEVNNNTAAIAVYPNPTSGIINISLTGTDNTSVIVSLYDITGKEVAVLFNGKNNAQTPLSFDLNDMGISNGVYYVKADCGTASGYQKVVKVD